MPSLPIASNPRTRTPFLGIITGICPIFSMSVHILRERYAASSITWPEPCGSVPHICSNIGTSWHRAWVISYDMIMPFSAVTIYNLR